MSEPSDGERRLTEALAAFGWTCGEEFWKRYYSDSWVFNLANAVDNLTDRLRAAEERADEAALRSIEASNPGIDMDEVRRHFRRTPAASGAAPYEEENKHDG